MGATGARTISSTPGDLTEAGESTWGGAPMVPHDDDLAAGQPVPDTPEQSAVLRGRAQRKGA